MRRRLFLASLTALCAFAAQPARTPASPERPKLVLVIVVDQFRYDYLTRFREAYSAGLDRLLRQGAVFTNAFYDHFPTVTAIGHSTVLTGATPAMSGIVGNSWYDRETGRPVTSVFDANAKLLGTSHGTASSPRRLLVSTIGDEMKLATRGDTKVIGISIKDRGAILPAGHSADGAYWFDDRTGNFVSSTYYFSSLPGWVTSFNQRRVPDRYAGKDWGPIEGASAVPFARTVSTPGPGLYASLEATPFGNDIVEEFAEAAIEAEQLGARAATDLLSVSFSSNDYVGHGAGPHSPVVRDISIRTDRAIGKLIDFAESKAGKGRVLVVFTGDHGVAPLPEYMQKMRMPGGRIDGRSIAATVEKRLTERFGAGKWVVGFGGPSPYLNHGLIREKKLDVAEVRRVAAQAISEMPHIFRVYTYDELRRGQVNPDAVGRRMMNGFHEGRAADVLFAADPYWLYEETGTSHGAPYSYDAHVPLIFMGPGVRAGRYHPTVRINDIAPTLATMLDVETPSGSVGRVLDEMMEPK